MEEEIIEDIELNQAEDTSVEEVDIEETDVEDKEDKSIEVDKTEEDKSTEESTEEKPKKQTAEERKRFAEMRRAKEAKEREEAIQKAKQQGVIEGLGGTNPYTNEKIVDDIDFKLYQEMKDADSKGYDVNDIKSMNQYRKQIELDALNKQKAQEQENIRVQKDIEDFTKNHSDVNVKELLADEQFKDFASDFLGSVSLETIYSKYKKFTDVAKKEAENIALEEKARRRSAPKPVSASTNAEVSYTLEDIKKMSNKEIEQNYEKILESYLKKK